MRPSSAMHSPPCRTRSSARCSWAAWRSSEEARTTASRSRAGLEDAIERLRPELVIDLSDEPVLGPKERFSLASACSRGACRTSARTSDSIPLASSRSQDRRSPSSEPGSAWARPRSRAISRGCSRDALESSSWRWAEAGRSEPERITVPPTLDALVEFSRGGRHAASDHFETAVLTGVETIGCRRCGGGLAGAVFSSNVAEGARLASSSAAIS